MSLDTQTILESLIERKDSLEKGIEELAKELQQVNSAIGNLGGNVTNYTRYNWSEKAIECIEARKQFLQTTEILECVLFGSDDLLDEKRRRNALVGLSVALNNLSAKGFLKKIVIQGVKGHLYGLPDWFEETGGPKREHIANFMARYGKIYEPVKLDPVMLAGAGLID